MLGALRSAARRLLGVTRTSTYYLPWIARPGLRCVLILNNVESRFTSARAGGPFPAAVIQYDARGTVVARYDAKVPTATEPLELPLDAVAEGHGFVTVDTARLQSDLYVTLGDDDAYTATHGRHEFVETYPAWTRAVHAALGAVAGLAGLTLPAFVRHQYVYVGAQDRSHVLLLNLSNVTNRIRTTAVADGATTARRLDAIAPRGAALLDLAALVAARAPGFARVMVTFDARYDSRVFPYRPHHYAYLKLRDSPDPPLYYAVNATLGGVPDRIEAATRQNNFESYLFLSRPAGERYGLRLGNLARFSSVEAQVITYHGEARAVVPVTLAPHQHADVELPLEREGARLRRVELKTLFRLASYVTGRRA